MVLDEARRTIDQQKRDLEGLRTRAAHLIGYATVVISVIGGLSLRAEGAAMTGWTWVSLAAFMVTALASAAVLRPRGLTLVADIDQMDGWIGEGDDVNHMMRSAALGSYADYRKNKPVLRRMHRAYLLGVVAVLVEVTVLLIDMAGR